MFSTGVETNAVDPQPIRNRAAVIDRNDSLLYVRFINCICKGEGFYCDLNSSLYVNNSFNRTPFSVCFREQI